MSELDRFDAGYLMALADVLARIKTHGKQDLAGWVDGRINAILTRPAFDPSLCVGGIHSWDRPDGAQECRHCGVSRSVTKPAETLTMAGAVGSNCSFEWTPDGIIRVGHYHPLPPRPSDWEE